MIRLKILLTESTTPDFSSGINDVKSEIQRTMEQNGRPQKQIDLALALIDKAKLSLEKHYVSKWKNKIPKTTELDASTSMPTPKQKDQIVSVTKNYIRHVITDLAPSIPAIHKKLLRIAWMYTPWEVVDKLTSNMLAAIENSVRGEAWASELEQEWIQWGTTFYLHKDHKFTEEMFDILVD